MSCKTIESRERDRLQYAYSLLVELAAIAEKDGMTMVSYMIGMAGIEVKCTL